MAVVPSTELKVTGVARARSTQAFPKALSPATVVPSSTIATWRSTMARAWGETGRASQLPTKPEKACTVLPSRTSSNESLR